MDGPTGEKNLFQMSPAECEEWLADKLKSLRPLQPIRYEVYSSLMIGEAATQRISLAALDAGHASEDLVETVGVVESIVKYLLDGERPRIDLITWDATGFVSGWYLNDAGAVDLERGSCPESVLSLSKALSALAEWDPEWRGFLQTHSAALAEIWRFSLNKAGVAVKQELDAQSWYDKLFHRTTEEVELLKLGFRAPQEQS
jgi:hypothetical protein